VAEQLGDVLGKHGPYGCGGLVRVRKVLDERDINQVDHRIVTSQHGALELIEEGAQQTGTRLDQRLGPTLDLCHEDMWKKGPTLIVDMFGESRFEQRELPHKVTYERPRLWLQ
jgi:hypothetical protein